MHHYFANRAEMTELELRRLMKQGRTSLLIGLIIMAAGCLLTIQTLLNEAAGT